MVTIHARRLGHAPGRDDLHRALRLVVLDGLASQAMVTLAGGVFLTAYALALGGSATVVGLIAAIPFLAQVFQVPGILLVERLRRRRAVTVAAAFGARLALLVVAAAFLLPAPWSLWALLGGLAAQSACGAVAGCAWNGWMRDLVPRRRLGRFFGRRLFLTTALGAVLSYAGARLVDGWGGGADIYGVLALAGAMAGFVGVGLLSATPEPAMPPRPANDNLLPLLAEPFRDANFRRLMAFLAVWGFAVNLATPFFTMVMLRDLGLGMAVVVPLTVAGHLANLAVLPLWGRLTDRLGNKPVLAVCGLLHVAVLAGWVFVAAPEAHAGTLPLLVVLHMVLGAATAGVTLASSTIALKLAPAGKGTAFLAMNGMVAALGSGIAPLLGGALADVMAAQEMTFTVSLSGTAGFLSVDALSLHGWDFFFAAAAGAAVYALHRLSLVVEPGAASVPALVRALVPQAEKKPASAAVTASGASSTRKWPASMGQGVTSTALRRHSVSKS